ncbi:unnamed protein product [Wickerhamomyces anomalus]
MSSIEFDGQPIAKDDCFYCFRTAFDSEGLNISTRHHKAFCKEHLALHYSLFKDDTIYLNYTKVAKPQREKTTKMIKLEIKQESESDLYDIKTQLFQYDGDSLDLITDINQETQATIDRIINSDSVNRKEELKTWQQEILPCEHTIEFQQTPIKDVQLTQCGECELKENLWICLTCGKLGCGRAQFGGVAGNTHALQHFEISTHPIAVKLGSLSKDVTDVYCYACNDEIKFPELSNCLKTFGIDLDNFTKTEKSLVELQIEQNLKWDFNMEGDNGEKLPSVFGPSLTGLKNLGNSCYLSSVVQSLFSLPEYSKFKKALSSFQDENDGLEFQLVKLANGLLSGDFSKPNSEGYQVGIAPISFKRLVGQDHEEFSSMRQQDAFEFWNYLLDKIDTIDSNLNDIFRFVTLEKFKFPNGNNEVKLKSQVNEILTLQVETELDHIEDGKKIYKRQDFIDSLIQYLSTEEIEWNVKGENSKVDKNVFFKTFPKYLVTSVQRIQLENWVPIKTDVPLTLPESFDIKDFQNPQVLEDGKVEVHDEDEDDNSFKPNTEALNNLQQMGFPEGRATKALYLTGNSDTEAAMNWLFQHLEDPTIDDPIDFKTKSKDEIQVDESQISSLQDMGFSAALAKKALYLNNNDVNASVEWLFSHPDDDGVIEVGKSVKTESPTEKLERLTKEGVDDRSEYSLKAVICHKGTQVTSGHYVVFIKKQDRWVLFNDEKVVDVTGDSNSWTEIEKNGYVYIWERV